MTFSFSPARFARSVVNGMVSAVRDHLGFTLWIIGLIITLQIYFAGTPGKVDVKTLIAMVVTMGWGIIQTRVETKRLAEGPFHTAGVVFIIAYSVSAAAFGIVCFILGEAGTPLNVMADLVYRSVGIIFALLAAYAILSLLAMGNRPS